MQHGTGLSPHSGREVFILLYNRDGCYTCRAPTVYQALNSTHLISLITSGREGIVPEDIELK